MCVCVCRGEGLGFQNAMKMMLLIMTNSYYTRVHVHEYACNTGVWYLLTYTEKSGRSGWFWWHNGRCLWWHALEWIMIEHLPTWQLYVHGMHRQLLNDYSFQCMSSQTTSIMSPKSIRPSGFFSCTLKNMGRPGYKATCTCTWVPISSGSWRYTTNIVTFNWLTLLLLHVCIVVWYKIW